MQQKQRREKYPREKNIGRGFLLASGFDRVFCDIFQWKNDSERFFCDKIGWFDDVT